jgi:hypothetical protein
MKKLILLAAIAALSAGCSSTGPKPETISKTNVVKANDIEKKRGEAPAGTLEQQGYICRTERPLGTRFGKKVCRSPQQIEEERRAAKEALPRHRECNAGAICN